MKSYENKRVVVTGAATGMGAATVGLLLEAGAEVHAIDIAPIEAPVTNAIQRDLSDPAEIEAALDAVEGPIDALFCCAGLAQTHSVEKVMAVNYLGTRHMVEAAVPRMAKGGAIAVISSAASIGWQQLWPLLKELHSTSTFAEGLAWCEAHQDVVGDGYIFGKQALSSWMLTRAPALGGQGIRLNALCPGMTQTPMMSDFEQTIGDLVDAFPAPLGRRGEPVEQAQGILFLNSAEASYITGIELFVDGGGSSVFNIMGADAMAEAAAVDTV